MCAHRNKNNSKEQRSFFFCHTFIIIPFNTFSIDLITIRGVLNYVLEQDLLHHHHHHHFIIGCFRLFSFICLIIDVHYIGTYLF